MEEKEWTPPTDAVVESKGWTPPADAVIEEPVKKKEPTTLEAGGTSTSALDGGKSDLLIPGVSTMKDLAVTEAPEKQPITEFGKIGQQATEASMKAMEDVAKGKDKLESRVKVTTELAKKSALRSEQLGSQVLQMDNYIKTLEGQPGKEKELNQAIQNRNAIGLELNKEIAKQNAFAKRAQETQQTIEEIPLGNLESVGNSMSNIATQLKMAIPQTMLGAGNIADKLASGAFETYLKLTGADLTDAERKEIAGMSASNVAKVAGQMPGLGDYSSDEAIKERFDQLGEIKKEMLPTKGIIDTFGKRDLGGFAAALFDAATSLGSSAIIGASTGGVGIGTTMIGDAIYEYNNEKAKSLGISIDELYNKGLDDVSVPFAIGSIAAALEKVGLEGVSNAINTKIAKAGVKEIANLVFEGGKEGATEWIQTGLETYNTAIASGKDPVQAGEEMWDKMNSKEGYEAALKGLGGSAVSIATGKAAKAIYNSVGPSTQKIVEPMAKKAEVLAAELENPALTTEQANQIEDEITVVTNEIKDQAVSDFETKINLPDEIRVDVDRLEVEADMLQSEIDKKESLLANPSISNDARALLSGEVSELKAKKMAAVTGIEDILNANRKPVLQKFTSPTDEMYGTVNRNDGKGLVTLTKEEFLKESGDSGIQEPVASVEEKIEVTGPSEVAGEPGQVAGQESGQESEVINIGGQKGSAANPSETDNVYDLSQEVTSNVSKENPEASILIQPKGDNLSLTAVYVGKEKRGKGIGSKVLASVKKEADRVGKKVVLDATNELDEKTDLVRLGKFYESNGFVKVGKNKYEYNPKNSLSEQKSENKVEKETLKDNQESPKPKSNENQGNKEAEGREEELLKAAETKKSGDSEPVSSAPLKEPEFVSAREKLEWLRSQGKEIADNEYFSFVANESNSPIEIIDAYLLSKRQREQSGSMKTGKEAVEALTGISITQREFEKHFNKGIEKEGGAEAKIKRFHVRKQKGSLGIGNRFSDLEEELEDIRQYGINMTPYEYMNWLTDYYGTNRQKALDKLDFYVESKDEARLADAFERKGFGKRLTPSVIEKYLEENYFDKLGPMARNAVLNLEAKTYEEAEQWFYDQIKSGQLTLDGDTPTSVVQRITEDRKREEDAKRAIAEAEERRQLNTPRNAIDVARIFRNDFGFTPWESTVAARMFDTKARLFAPILGLTREQYYQRYWLTSQSQDGLAQKEYTDVINGFYSPLEKIINETKFEKLPAKQWLDKFGKSEEAKWTGLQEWLQEQQGSLSKADIQKFLRDNRIGITEVVKGGEKLINATNKQEAIAALDAGYTLSDSEGIRISRERLEDNRYPEPNYPLEVDNLQSDTKFSQYQLEGEKDNYKEVLVTLPTKIDRAKAIKLQNGNWAIQYSNGEKSPFEYKSKQFAEKAINEGIKNKGEIKKTGEFRSSHFDEPNILVHLRMNTRTDAEGNKVLFLEEIQSDWGQIGKKEGFSSGAYTNEDAKRAKELNNKFDTEGLSPTEMTELTNLKRKEKGISLTPAAPFVTDTNAWAKLGLKVALKEAVAQGADKIAWTTGEQQNERYDLSKQVDEIRVYEPKKYNKEDFRKNYFKRFEIITNTKDIIELRVDKDGVVVYGNDINGSNTYNGKNISDIVGKEFAAKMMKADFNTVIKGEQLKVGGKGMIGFYGSPTEGKKGIIGGVAEKLFGQEVGTVVIETAKQNEYTLGEANYVDGVGVYDGNGDMVAEFDTKKEANDFIAKKQSFSQPSVDITPELRAEVQKGLPLFQDQETRKGSWSKEAAYAKRIIGMYQKADSTTAIHEILGHDYFDNIIQAAELGDKQSIEDLNTIVEEYIKEKKPKLSKAQVLKIVKDFNIETNYTEAGKEVHEWFATAAERYFASGDQFKPEIANSKLGKLFEKFRQHVANLYQAMNKALIAPSPQMKKVFRRLFGEENFEVLDINDRVIQQAKEDNERVPVTEKASKLVGKLPTKVKKGLGQEDDSNYLKAPNGKKSNLNAKQWEQVRTKAFKNWFGDWENDPKNASKVIDENGEPLVVYHGTLSNEFDVFDIGWDVQGFFGGAENLGIFFGTINQAKEISGGSVGYGAIQSGNSRVIPVFLNSKNPIVLNDDAKFWMSADNVVRELSKVIDVSELEILVEEHERKGKIYTKKPISADFEFEVENDTVAQVIRPYLKSKGYDGVVYKNMVDAITNEGESSGNSYIVFNPKQIKSATDNTGSFSKKTPNILYQGEDEMTPEEILLEAAKDLIQSNESDKYNIVNDLKALVYKETGSKDYWPDIDDLKEQLEAIDKPDEGKIFNATVERALADRNVSPEIKKNLRSKEVRERDTYSLLTQISDATEVVNMVGPETLANLLLEEEGRADKQFQDYEFATLSNIVAKRLNAMKKGAPNRERRDQLTKLTTDLYDALSEKGSGISRALNSFRAWNLLDAEGMEMVIRRKMNKDNGKDTETAKQRAKKMEKEYEKLKKDFDYAFTGLLDSEEVRGRLEEEIAELNKKIEDFEKRKGQRTKTDSKTGKPITKGREFNPKFGIDDVKNFFKNKFRPGLSQEEVTEEDFKEAVADLLSRQKDYSFSSFVKVFNSQMGENYTAKELKDLYETTVDYMTDNGYEGGFSDIVEINDVILDETIVNDAAAAVVKRDLLVKHEKEMKAYMEKQRKAFIEDVANKMNNRELWEQYVNSVTAELVSKVSQNLGTGSNTDKALLDEFTSLVKTAIKEKLDEVLPVAKGQPVQKTAKELAENIADLANNEEKFADVFDAMVEKLQEKYKNDVNAVNALQALANIQNPFSDKLLSKAVSKQFEGTGWKLGDVAFGRGTGLMASQMAQQVLSDGGLLGTAAEAVLRPLLEDAFQKNAKRFEDQTLDSLANYIVNDAKKAVGAVSPANKTFVEEMVGALKRKVRENYKANNKTAPADPMELIKFALKETGKADQVGGSLWSQAQGEVIGKIMADPNLTQGQKMDAIDFLRDFSNSVFDTIVPVTTLERAIVRQLKKSGIALDANGNIPWESLIKGVDGQIDALREQVELAIRAELGNNYNPALVDLMVNRIVDQYDSMITEKKKAMFEKQLASFSSEVSLPYVKDRKIGGMVGKLLAMDKSGLLDAQAFNDLVSEYMGIKSLSMQEWNELQYLLRQIEDSPEGFERVTAIENVTLFLESKQPMYGAKVMRAIYYANLLSGFSTAIKNLTGIFDVFFKAVGESALQLDPTYLKLALKGLSQGDFADIIKRGSANQGDKVDIPTDSMGLAHVNTLERWRKYPGLRNKVFGSLAYVSRVLNATDAAVQRSVQEQSDYYLTKKDLKFKNPSLTTKAIREMALANMFRDDITFGEAVEMAVDEMNARGMNVNKGIVLSELSKNPLRQNEDTVRAKRRAYEIMRKNRLDEVRVYSGKDALKTAFKTEFEDNKGIFTGMGKGLMSLFEIIGRGFGGLGEFLADRLNTSEAKKKAIKESFAAMPQTLIMPIIRGVSNVAEVSAEKLLFYGPLKGTVKYLTAIDDNNKNFKKINKAMTTNERIEFEYKKMQALDMITSSLAANIFVGVVTAMLMEAVPDDDEELKNGFYAAGASVNTAKRGEKAKMVVIPENSIVIGGEIYSFSWFGTMALSLSAYANYEETKNNEDFGIADFMLGTLSGFLSASMFEPVSRFSEVVSPKFKTDKTMGERVTSWMENIGLSAITNTFMPWSNMQAQIAQGGKMIFKDGMSEDAIGVYEKMVKKMPLLQLIPGVGYDRPSLDYTGDPIPMEVKNPGSAASLFQWAQDRKIPEFKTYDAKIGLNTPFNGKTLDNTIAKETMTDEQYYDYRKDVSVAFKPFQEANFKNLNQYDVIPPENANGDITLATRKKQQEVAISMFGLPYSKLSGSKKNEVNRALNYREASEKAHAAIERYFGKVYMKELGINVDIEEARNDLDIEIYDVLPTEMSNADRQDIADRVLRSSRR